MMQAREPRYETPALAQWSRDSARSEQAVAGVAQPRQDVTLIVELSIEGGAIDDDIGMCLRQSANAFWRGNQAKKANAGRTGSLE